MCLVRPWGRLFAVFTPPVRLCVYIYIDLPSTGQAHGRARVGDCSEPCNGSCKSSSLAPGLTSFASPDLHRYSCCSIVVWCTACEVLLFLAASLSHRPPATSRHLKHVPRFLQCPAIVFKCNPGPIAVSIRRMTNACRCFYLFVVFGRCVIMLQLGGRRRKKRGFGGGENPKPVKGASLGGLG